MRKKSENIIRFRTKTSRTDYIFFYYVHGKQSWYIYVESGEWLVDILNFYIFSSITRKRFRVLYFQTCDKQFSFTFSRWMSQIMKILTNIKSSGFGFPHDRELLSRMKRWTMKMKCAKSSKVVLSFRLIRTFTHSTSIHKWFSWFSSCHRYYFGKFSFHIFTFNFWCFRQWR